MRPTVNFKGLKQVVKAYINNDVPAWAILSGTNLLFTYDGEEISEGSSQLQQAFKMLHAGGSEAGYTLRVYKLVPKGGIVSNTPHSNAFTFGLFDYEGDQSPYQKRNNSIVGVLETRMQVMQDALMEKILKKVDIDEQEEKEVAPSGIMGVVGKLLENPQIQQVLMQKLMGWLGVSSAPAAIGSVPPAVSDSGDVIMLAPDQSEKLNQALTVLAKADPKIGDHLLKVAIIARDNPGKYNMLTGML